YTSALLRTLTSFPTHSSSDLCNRTHHAFLFLLSISNYHHFIKRRFIGLEQNIQAVPAVHVYFTCSKSNQGKNQYPLSVGHIQPVMSIQVRGDPVERVF